MSDLKQLAIVSAILLVLLAPAIASSDEISVQSCPAASRLDLGNRYYGYISSAGEIDWMRWDPPDSGKFAVTLEVPAGHDYDLEVYVVCNKPACKSTNEAGEEEKCTIVNPGPGNVYAKIYGYKNDYSPTAKYYITGVMEKPVVDLEATLMALKPAAPTDKDYVDFIYTFVNMGPDDISGSFDNKFYIDGTEKNKYRASGLKKLSWISRMVSGIKLPAGSHTLKQHTDVGNEIEESTESNNVYTQDIEVSHLVQHDLAITAYHTKPQNPDDRTRFDFVWTVKNIGSDDITTPFYSKMTFEGELRELCQIDGLKSGATHECVSNSEKWSAGAHWGVLEVDPYKSISESDEGNNGMDWEIVVKHIPDVDLSVPSIYAEPASVNEKTAFTLKYDVKNSGSEAVDKPFKSQLYIDNSLKGTCDHDSGLGSGQVQSCGVPNQKWQIGSYSVRAVADVDNAIVETIEGNNELTQPINVADSCVIPDGSAADCECNDNTDCPSGYYCEFRTGFDACVKVTCNDECSSSGFFCSEGDSYECGSFDSDPCSDKRIVDSCGVGEVCTEGERSCLIDPAPVGIHAEDASPGTAVYKQPGDLIEVTVYSEKEQGIIFSYPENFTLSEGPCVNGEMLVAGDKACLFRISDTIAEGNYYFSAKGKVAKVTVTSSPSTIIVTNKQKLRERFPDDLSGVDSLLKQAFQFANAQGSTVVYYLDRELQGHPFASFGSYSESILSPSLSSNPYGMSVAEFINKKCGQCKNTIILGDDYVVPFYRVDYSTIHSFFAFWINNKTETSSIYSDQPYIKENRKTVGDLSSLFDSNEHKNVKIVIPDSPSAEVQERVEQLKSVLKSGFEYDDNEISVINSGKIGCNSYGTLDKATLILVGSRDDNNAIKCVPWFDVGRKTTDTFKASIEVERNVWANNEYAIILSGDVNSAITALIDMLQNPIYYNRNFMHQSDTVYIHEFSKPSELTTSDDYFQGFVLGKCEAVGKSFGEQAPCMASDVTLSLTPGVGAVTDARDFGLFCYATVKEGGKTNFLICATSFGGVLSSIGTVVLTPTVVGAAASESADVFLATTKGILKTLKSAMKASPGFEKIAKIVKVSDTDSMKNFFNAAKKTDKEMLDEAQKRIAKLTSTPNKRFALNALSGLDETALKDGIKNIDDLEDAAKGSEVVLSEFKTMDDFHKALPEVERLRLIKKIGKYDELIKQKRWVRYTGEFMTYKGISKQELTGIMGFKDAEDVLLRGIGAPGKKDDLLAYVAGSKYPGIFQGSSQQIEMAAKEFANKEFAGGFVFEIDPRALNGVDVIESLKPLRDAGKIDEVTWKTIEREFEITYLERIDPQDIKGYWNVDFKGERIGDFIPNRNYIG